MWCPEVFSSQKNKSLRVILTWNIRNHLSLLAVINKIHWNARLITEQGFTQLIIEQWWLVQYNTTLSLICDWWNTIRLCQRQCLPTWLRRVESSRDVIIRKNCHKRKFWRECSGFHVWKRTNLDFHRREGAVGKWKQHQNGYCLSTYPKGVF